jgi:hypothetical protein
MGDRMSRRNTKHFERLRRNHAARRSRQIKIAGRNFYLESELLEEIAQGNCESSPASSTREG